MNIHDLESTLQEHGNIVKNHISPPFSIESQPLRAKPRVSVCRTLAIVAAIVLTLSVGAYAIHQLWDADEVAAYFDRPKLAEAFAAQLGDDRKIVKQRDSAVQNKNSLADESFGPVFIGVDDGEDAHKSLIAFFQHEIKRFSFV